MRLSRLAALLLCIAAAPQTVRASTVIYRTDAELIARSARVVHGRVLGQRTTWGGPDGRTIYTVTRLDVVEDFTGEPGDTVEVWELGGTIGNYFQYVGGAVEFEIGRDVIVCLERGPHGLRTVAMGFSKFDVLPSASGGGQLSRDARGMMIVGGRVPDRERTVDEFRALAAQVTGRSSVRRPEAVTGEYQAPVYEGFTKLGGEPGWRWSQADSGVPVRWYKNTAAPNPLVSGDAVNEIQTALAGWTNPVSASIILQYSGTTNQPNPKGSWVGLGDGDALISFEDPNNEISGSTLAIGGGDGFIGTGGTVNGTTFNGFAHGYVIFQNAADLPSSFRQSLNFTRVLEHEVGHAIGLGHTQQDGSVPNATSNIMYASCCATETPVPPAIGPDDLAGLNFIYPGIVCTYAISPTNVNVGPAAATGSVSVTTQAGCAWTAASNASFLNVNSGSSGSGNGTVNYGVGANGVSYRTGTMTIAGQTFTVSQTGTGPTMSLDKTSLRFGATTSGSTMLTQTPSQILRLSQSGAGTVTWTASANQPWLTVSPSSGTGPTTFSVGVKQAVTIPAAGEIFGSITLNLSGAAAPLQPVTVTLRLMPSGSSSNPFGAVDTPANGSVGVAGAVPFTGWALDDVGLARLTVCRAAVTGESVTSDARCANAAQIYVGDGVFIEGARPDVKAAYPAYPANDVAGWGLQVLTNMLPGQGNGTYTFYMYAQDREGHKVLLGNRTITCDNAHATTPFGTIDTPGQGGIASGASFVNFGWALTPQPKSIPFDGSTINVFVDGVPVGHVTYNNYRTDIATLFPGLINSNGAVGYKVIDTTALADGVHTIAWGVVDSAGKAAGLGSRFFVVSNASSPGGSLTSSLAGAPSAGVEGTLTMAPSVLLADGIAGAPLDTTPLSGRRGWNPEAPWQTYTAGRSGRVIVRGEEIDRLELKLGDGTYSGYMRVGTELAPLPVGSRLEPSGVFTWQPGVGFVGAYDLVFVRWADGGAVSRREVRVVLSQKNSGRVGPRVMIDTPRSQMDVGQPFLLAGWALDLDADEGTGVDTLHVWAYPLAGGAPVFVGVASYGGSRPDVGATYGEQFNESGFGLIIQGLTPGNYDLAVFPWSTVSGGFAPAQVVRVTVR